jgi:hypothetical protein
MTNTNARRARADRQARERRASVKAAWLLRQRLRASSSPGWHQHRPEDEMVAQIREREYETMADEHRRLRDAIRDARLAKGRPLTSEELEAL